MTASKNGDLATVLGLMTDDVVFMVPGQEPFGKEAFAAASRDMSGVKLEGTSDVLELRVIGDWAFIRNHIEMTAPRPAARARAARGTHSPCCARKAMADGGLRAMPTC